MTSGDFTLKLTVQGSGQQAAGGTASSTVGVAGPSWQTSTPASVVLSFGTGAANFDTVVWQVRTLAASASETLNLFDGSLTDVFGIAAPLANYKVLAVVRVPNPDGSTNSTSVTVTPGVSNPLAMPTPSLTVYSGGVPGAWGSLTGFTVSNTAKNLTLTNDDGTNAATYQLVVAGVGT